MQICTNFGSETLRGLGYTGGGKILGYPIEMAGHPYNSAALPRSLWYQYFIKICVDVIAEITSRDAI